MNILIPIASRSRLFPPEDFPFPTPLIEIDEMTVIERVIENLRGVAGDGNFIFVVSAHDVVNFSIDKTLREIAGDRCKVVVLSNPTRGALCSCLMAIGHIDPETPLLISNGDQIFDEGLPQALEYFKRNDADAGVITFRSVHPRWSYICRDSQNNVLQAEEKKVISKNAIAGAFFYKRGGNFVEAAMASILADANVGGQFYIAPSLNHLILANKKVVSFEVENGHYHSFFSPQRIKLYEERILARGERNLPKGGSCSAGINVLIPAAGAGSRFVEAGYDVPKPFIDVAGRAMIDHVIDNIDVENRMLSLLFQESHVRAQPDLINELKASGHRVIEVSKLTEGTACTVLLARRHIDNDTPLLIANSDQYVDFDCQAFVDDCHKRGLDGSMLVFKDPSKNPKWSFAQIGPEGYVLEVAEKKPISDIATVGIYYFRAGSMFVSAAIDMIVNNDRVSGEFYTCPVYNYMIRNGAKVGVFEVPQTAMHGLGTPEDLEAFLARKRA